MDNRIRRVESEIDSITSEAVRSFADLTPEQINWKPSDESWSVGQCLDHLIKTSEIYSVDIDGISGGTHRAGFLERFSPLSGFYAKFMIKAKANDEKKVKTKDRFIPEISIDQNIVGLFTDSQEKLKQTVRATAHLDWQKTFLTSPFFSFITYSLADAFTILTEHQRRHLRQAERVAELGDFPKRS